jgi:hypothetical protein
VEVLEGLGGPQGGCPGQHKKILRGGFGEGYEAHWDRVYPIWRRLVAKLRIKAKVLTKRMIPIGDPRLKGMNDTQWVFELESMNLQEKQRYDDIRTISDAVRRQMVSMLGLNLLPLEDEKTGKLRLPEEDECLPLALLIGNDNVLTAIKSRTEEYLNQQAVLQQLSVTEEARKDGKAVDTGVVEMSPEELEAFMNDDGDVEFENAPEDLLKAMKWGGRDTQVLLENLVLAKEDLGDDPLKEKDARTIGAARQDLKKRYGKKTVESRQEVEVEEVDLGLSPSTSEQEKRPVVTLDVK